MTTDPRRGPSENSPGARNPRSAGELPAPIILVVEDEPLLRWALGESLLDAGFPVTDASTGVDAIAAIDELDPAEPLVIVLDLKLPDVSDLSLARSIRARRPSAPLIMMSAHASASDRTEAGAAGVDRFFAKPFDVVELVESIRELYSSRARACPTHPGR